MIQKKISRLTVVASEMIKTSVVKNKFPQLNDKSFYFLLPFYHPNLTETNKYEQNMGQRIEKYIWQEKDHLLNLKNKH